MRLYPTAPLILRDIVEDIEFDGVHVPAGTIGIIPIYAIHRHRGFWHDPDRFDPSRFAPNHTRKPSRFQFMPFGAGPRICIGAAFAMMEATIMMATFLRAARFEIEPGFDPQPTGQMFLLPKEGHADARHVTQSRSIAARFERRGHLCATVCVTVGPYARVR